ncbi:MAG: PspA/IM30 family protein [Lachnospiraceae bacterium]|nr:PspA/IM30 family protein [Lachnospiraceae bacterium]MBD5513414.1 PspA/IM30 family protein [Lachnospiraceae bacterium]
MGIMTRFKDIMTANVNALLDKAEDPEKMIDQYLRNLESDFAKVKAETASIMAEEKSAKRKLGECDEEIAKMGDYAKKAVAAGNDNDARQFLTKKSELTQKREVLVKNYEMARDNAEKMRQMHDKLEADISEMKSKRDMLKAKAKAAQTQRKINEMGAGLESAGNNAAAFNRMEEKVNKMLDEADAIGELNKSASGNDIDDLTSKYDTADTGSDVDDELAALKAEMGMN